MLCTSFKSRKCVISLYTHTAFWKSWLWNIYRHITGERSSQPRLRCCQNCSPDSIDLKFHISLTPTAKMQVFRREIAGSFKYCTLFGKCLKSSFGASWCTVLGLHELCSPEPDIGMKCSPPTLHQHADSKRESSQRWHCTGGLSNTRCSWRIFCTLRHIGVF